MGGVMDVKEFMDGFIKLIESIKNKKTNQELVQAQISSFFGKALGVEGHQFTDTCEAVDELLQAGLKNRYKTIESLKKIVKSNLAFTTEQKKSYADFFRTVDMVEEGKWSIASQAETKKKITDSVVSATLGRWSGRKKSDASTTQNSKSVNVVTPGVTGQKNKR